MEDSKKCPICECEEIGKGRIMGAGLFPLTLNPFKMGSEILADICINCGYVLSMRVKNPKKFKK
jgi:hypothetical protein